MTDDIAESEFDGQTAVQEHSPGRYSAMLDAGWSVGGGLNGGYLLAVIGTAVKVAVPDKPDPLVISAHYTSASRAGPAEIVTAVRREGGTVATVGADLVQEGTTRVAVLATCGDLSRHGHEIRTSAPPPEMPPVEDCIPGSMAPDDVREAAPLMSRFDMRFHPDQVGWAIGKPSGVPVLSAWFRLADGREPDPISLLLAVDALPPVTFALGMPGWAPTLELTAHVRALPAPGWLLLRHETRNLAGGLFEEDCEVWDTAGRLVAQSRQLALAPRP